jgi:hypothetical protein
MEPVFMFLTNLLATAAAIAIDNIQMFRMSLKKIEEHLHRVGQRLQ